MVTHHTQVYGIACHFKREAILTVHASFPDAGYSLDLLCVQGGMTGVLCQQANLFINFLLDGAGKLSIEIAEALLGEYLHAFRARNRDSTLPLPRIRPRSLSS